MRQIERHLMTAIQEKRAWKQSNTELKLHVYSSEWVEMTVLLWGSAIARITPSELTLNDCGYPTVTTKNRLNAVLAGANIPAFIYQENWHWYISRFGVREMFYNPYRIEMGLTLEQFCIQHGFSEPFRHDGDWWAFPANGVMAVPIPFRG